MYNIKLVYNEASEELLHELQKYSNFVFTLESFDEDSYKEKKKAFALKGIYAAKKLPFAVIYENNEGVKAFYSEDDSCTLFNIMNWVLDSLISKAKKGYIKIRKIEGINNDEYNLGMLQQGFTNAFIEGLPLKLSNATEWYHTSNIQSIDWENKIFKTKNSTYNFEFDEC